ncbi:uncharacterized protein yc1106_08046 [Curvularia clavata]|uniref:Uncharacterized protein n=1 Tax=Curvularia clavata TaxID=95742 RepID=A0A9Q8ZCN1_CURCL|nr:uncharacterized protein yc1106_08046 [Curvularia clavata]
MHRFSSSVLLFPLLKSYLSEARPAPQADPAPCSTVVNLPEATLTISPGPSNAVVNGFPDGATSTIEANGPAITIGPDVLSLNADNNVNLNGFVFLFSDNLCPAVVIPITTLPTSSESTALVPVPAPTDTPDGNPDAPTNPEPVPDPSPPENPDTPVDPPSDPPEDPPSEDPNPPVVPIPIPSPVDPVPVPDPNPVDPVPNPVDPVPNPVDPVPGPVDPVPDPVDPVPEPVVPVPVPVPDPVDPVDPVPNPVDPVDPTITPPPSPPPPNNEDPNECETQTANVCTQGCSFGTDSLGVTTTTSCKDPTCTATAACSVSDTTSTTTIEAPACSLELNGGVASGYPFPVDGDGPLPRADAAPTAPAPADPQPTPSEPEVPPSEPTAPVPAPTEEPAAPPSPPESPSPSTQVFEAGKLTAGDGTESIVIYSHGRDESLNVCNATPFYKESTLVGLSKKFDIPDSDYKNCDFVGIGNEPLGIYCEGKDRLPCVLIEGSQLQSCLAGDGDVFGVTWKCNE